MLTKKNKASPEEAFIFSAVVFCCVSSSLFDQTIIRKRKKLKCCLDLDLHQQEVLSAVLYVCNYTSVLAGQGL
jgi:hypothetical protein